MVLNRIVLKNFRNIETVTLEPGEGFNIFWGNNAQGKTNIVEGIYFLGNLKSFRTALQERLIKEGERQTVISGQVTKGRVEHEIRIVCEVKTKKVLLDGKRPAGAGMLTRIHRQVLFSPEEVNLVRGGPSGRRDLLDRAVYLTDPAYLTAFQKYRKVLRQRNVLLKKGSDRSQLAPWTDALVEKGTAIRRARANFIHDFVPYFEQTYAHLIGAKEKAEFLLRDSAVHTADVWRENLDRLTEREYGLGQTVEGPHRDEPDFFIDGRDIRQFGSQGQQRSFALAFKTALVEYLGAQTGEMPLLLLDDMTGELDSERRGSFFNYLKDRGAQVFITTTDPDLLCPSGFPRARYYRVEAGKVFHDQG